MRVECSLMYALIIHVLHIHTRNNLAILIILKYEIA